LTTVDLKETSMVKIAAKHDAKPHVSGDIHNYEAMLERARALVPTLKERSCETEALRRLPANTERDLHDAGLFRILQPRRVGGSEFDYVALVDFAAMVARGDASVGWNLANLASHHWMLGMFAPEAQNRVWNENPDALIASSFVFPSGHAKRVDGGYILRGRWPFSSGVEPSDWNMLAGFVESDDEADGYEYRIFLLHKREYVVIDTWNSSGLRGTGSHDVEVTDVFVPDAMTLAVSALHGGPTPGSAVNPGTLYRLPVFALFPYVLTGIGLGNAQACLEDYIASARSRSSKYNMAKLSDFQSTHIKVAEAGAKIDAAARIMRGTCIDAMADAERGVQPDMLTRTRYRRDGAYTVNLCTEAVTLLFSASGAGALYTSNALQRQFRDAHAVNAHIAFNFDAAGANYGRVALGFPSENPTL
jgi:3-hydroxy-9,10-secoandrosta-1,3,5(10)-triene-9,17-dione monooxygenase